MGLLKPMSDKIAVIQEMKEKNRGSEFFNHLSTLSEAVPAFGWVAIVSTEHVFSKCVVCGYIIHFRMRGQIVYYIM